MEELDIYSKGIYPADALSNFYPHSFVIDDIRCGSMEGFLQSLKYRSVRKQKKICLLSGKEAKKRGDKKILWKWTGKVHWKGQTYRRDSSAYIDLIERAYDRLFENDEFRTALKDSSGKELMHSLGKKNPSETILTEKEFIASLERLRKKLDD